MKVGLLAASLALVAGGAAGCGGGDGGGGASDAPSTKDFCGALSDFKDSFSAADPTGDLKDYIKTVKDAADRLAEVGTPDSMPADAEDGFALTVDKIESLPDDATVDDLAGVGDVSEDDQKKLDALQTYIEKSCPGLTDSGS